MKVKSRKYPGVYIYKSRVRPGDECYYIMYWAYGRKVNEKVGWKSEGYTQEQAHKVRSDRIHAIRHGKELPKKEKAPTFTEAWELYHSSMVGNISKGPEKVHEQRFKKYLKPSIGSKRINSITPAHIRDLIGTLEKDLHRSTVVKYLSIIRATYRIMKEEYKYRGPNPMDQIKYQVKDRERMRFLTKEEASKILQAMAEKRNDLYIFTVIGLFTGMRSKEIMSIKGRDINFESGLIRVTGKGTNGQPKERFCEINPEVERLLKTVKLGPNDRLFKQKDLSQAWQPIVDELGLNDGVDSNNRIWRVTPHTLRHTFGSWLGQAGVSPYVIQDVMGHDNIQTSMRYTKLGPRPGKDAVRNLTEGMDMDKK